MPVGGCVEAVICLGDALESFHVPVEIHHEVAGDVMVCAGDIIVFPADDPELIFCAASADKIQHFS